VKQLFTLIVILIGLAGRAQQLSLAGALFTTGDSTAWAAPSFNDSQWKTVTAGKVWQSQGYPGYHGFAWYRMHVVIPSALRSGAGWKDSLRVFLAHVNDVDETYLNGVRIGKTGRFPGDVGGYDSKWPFVRDYRLAVDAPCIRWDKDNVIAVRVYDGGGTGGIFMGQPFVTMLEKTDGIHIGVGDVRYGSGSSMRLLVDNQFNTSVSGQLDYVVEDIITGKEILHRREDLSLAPMGQRSFEVSLPNREGIRYRYTFTEKNSGKQLQDKQNFAYILTPSPGASPRINGSSVFGCRPGSPILWKIPATGERPLRFGAEGLPEGLVVDGTTGIISGKVSRAGVFSVLLSVANSLGVDKRRWTLHVGDTLGYTPAMGWNSWNCWGLSVNADRVRSSAQAMLDKGLADHGWNYINIDDGWEAAERAADGTIYPNEKFPDMKALSDWLHDRGLKFGIYSSPGPRTCGGFLGSYSKEAEDAHTYANWGVDYLKYDWCSYDAIAGKDTSLQAYMKPYQVMQRALRAQPRDILYSLCQYGMGQVWKWGPQVDAQSWRTTGDIEDTWSSLRSIGFRQSPLYPYAGPGHFNDPDMLIVGQVGWGENLHPTRLTPDEQYTHVSLWCMLSAPLLLGCDLSKLDPFTLNLLTNDEVLAIDQDALGRQAHRQVAVDGYQVYVKSLADGSVAVGVFNLDDSVRHVSVNWRNLGLEGYKVVRDVWRQVDRGSAGEGLTGVVMPHGVLLLRLRK